MANRAAGDRSIGKKFAIREANSSGDITVYALAQCIPDMSSSSCLNCLRNVINVLHKCCDELRGARVQFPSCFMRHEVYPFYNQHNVPALSKHQGAYSFSVLECKSQNSSENHSFLHVYSCLHHLLNGDGRYICTNFWMKSISDLNGKIQGYICPLSLLS
ncbi:Cysteine-rich receptor-like protein kinase 25 [Capsicum chinense]|nr:Cysteine-rich receptor-like protein kinase 25 [Capsicum chinense]